MRPPALFFLKVILAIQSPLRFIMNFWMVISLSAKSAIGIFFKINLFIFTFGCVGSLLLCEGFL